MKIKVEFEIEMPDIFHTEEELEAFLRYEFRDNGEIHSNNPFKKINAKVEPIFGSFEWDYCEK